MGQYQQLFSLLPDQALGTERLERVLDEAARKRAASRRLRFWVGSIGSLASLCGVIAAVPLLVSAASASGFSVLASLALTDSDAVFAHAGMFLASLIETMPGLDAALVLALVAALFVSLRSLVRALPRHAHTLRPALIA